MILKYMKRILEALEFKVLGEKTTSLLKNRTSVYNIFCNNVTISLIKLNFEICAFNSASRQSYVVYVCSLHVCFEAICKRTYQSFRSLL